MKKIQVTILCFFLSTVFFIAGILFSNFLIKENKNIEGTKRLERKDITRIKRVSKRSPEIDTDLTEANNIARKMIEAMFYNDSYRLRQYGIIVDPYAVFSQSMYEDIIGQTHELYSSEGERSIIDLFGYGNHEAILYIFGHYQDWYSVFVGE